MKRLSYVLVAIAGILLIAAYTPFVAGTGITLTLGVTGLKISTNSGATGLMNDTVVANGASPYTVLAADVMVLASAGAASATVVNFPAATGTKRVICVKKQDSNAFNVAVTPNGADTIDGVNAADNIITQYASNCYNDYASGAWAKF